MLCIDKHNDIEYSLHLDDNIIYIQSNPKIENCHIHINTIESKFVSSNVNLSNEGAIWFRVDYKYFLIVGVVKNKEILYRKLLFKQLEYPLINKKDITIVVDNKLNMNLIRDLYESFGKIVIGNYGDNYDTKYVVYLKNYLINIVYLINKTFFNYGHIIQDPVGNVFMMEKNNCSQILIDYNLEIKNNLEEYDIHIT